jgi:GntR family transcriptional regulator
MPKEKMTGKWPEKNGMSDFVTEQVPRYYQLATILKSKITNGEFAPNGQIPTELELVKQYGLSRITVRQGLRMLEDEGLIRREVGRGSFVNPTTNAVGGLQLEGSLDELISQTATMSAKVLHFEHVTATASDAAMLQLQPGEKLVRCTRLRFHEGHPLSYVINDLPWEIGRRLKRNDFRGLFLRVLEQKFGIDVIEAQQTVRSKLADVTIAKLLDVAIGAPLLVVDRVVYTHNHRPVERVRTHYRGDVYSIRVHLARNSGKASWDLKSKKAAVGRTS